jgi:hypothetical protein
MFFAFLFTALTSTFVNANELNQTLTNTFAIGEYTNTSNSQISDQSFKDALIQTLGLPPSPYKDKALTKIALSIFHKDPSTALNMLYNTAQPTQLRLDAMLYMLQSWAKTNYEAALTWAKSLPKKDRELALCELGIR